MVFFQETKKMSTNNSKLAIESAVQKRRENFLSRILPFEPQKMTPTMTAAIFASRGSGKSVLIKELMCYKMKHYDLCIVCCPTTDARETYGDIVGNEFIFDQEKDILNCIKTVVRKQSMYTQAKCALRILLVLDDVGYLKEVVKMSEYKQLFMNGRHLEIGLMAIYQYPKAIPPDFRRNLDYAMFLSQASKDIEGIHEDMFKGDCSFNDLKWIFDTVTASRGVLIVKIEKVSQKKGDISSVNIMDRLYHYTADVGLPRFQIGSRGMWKMHYMFCRENSEKHKPKGISLFEERNSENKINEDEYELYQEDEVKRLQDIKKFQEFKSRGKLEPVVERPLPSIHQLNKIKERTQTSNEPSDERRTIHTNEQRTPHTNHNMQPQRQMSSPHQTYIQPQTAQRVQSPLNRQNETRKKIDSLVRSMDEIDNQFYKPGTSELGSTVTEHIQKNFNY